MIKVVCIEIPECYKHLNFELEFGKIYEVKQSPYVSTCWIINNTNISYDPATNISYIFINHITCDKKYFITLAEWRQQQIDKILNNEEN
jgi:hypothetical protein